MDRIFIYGGRPLQGTVKIGGSKNSALPILAATLLTRGKCTISRVPDLSDIHYMLTILSTLGCEVERASGIVRVCAQKIRTQALYDTVRKMRASVCIIGPLLGREGEATVSLPGGCVIGDRPIDLHLRGFEKLGTAIRMQGGNIKALAPRLRGNTVFLRGKRGSTVLGTDNIMMAAVLADGTTVIEGAAEEPEVVDLASFLVKMGACIKGAGTSRIVIEGVKELYGAEHEIIPDRIEAGTFLVAAAICGRGVTVQQIAPQHLQSVTDTLRKIGLFLEIDTDSITLHKKGKSQPLEVDIKPHPGFPTDMQAQMCALLSTTEGLSTITDHIFPRRFMHLAELKRTGANIELEGATATIQGVPVLGAAPVMASDLRASAALILAGLQAEGVTEVHRVYHIDRGYERIDEKLNGLGAYIERVKTASSTSSNIKG
jgi:UDP-N-acetylglucosamine 1-carboxyvinyltransferase